MADRSAGTKARRTWPQRLLITVNVMSIVAALVTAGALGYSNKQLSEVTRVDLKGVLAPKEEKPVGAPVNYLLVGADTSVGLDPDDPTNRGRRDEADKFRTDTIMVLRIDPGDATARVLSFPRDLWIEIPGRTSKTRINAAVEIGGAKLLIETIQQDFGISIDHYVQVNFAGFKELVTAIGGVPIYFPEPVRSIRSTPFEIPEPGCYTLDGNQALDFVRIRKDYQVYRDGRWRTDLAGDIGRIARQQYFIQVALKRAISKGIRDPNTLRQLVDLGIDSVKIDDQLRTEDIVELGSRFRNFDPDNLIKYTVPATNVVRGGADVLEIIESEAEPLFESFRGTSTGDPIVVGGSPSEEQALGPANVRVQVQNGGETQGQAGDVTDELTALDFDMVGPTDAPLDFPGTQTTVQYAPGKLAQARYVARFISADVVLEEDPDLVDADVAVIIATDWEGIETIPKPDNEVPVPTTSPTTTTSSTVPTEPTTTLPVPSTSVVGELPGDPLGIQSC